jgi:hypothetical protein
MSAALNIEESPEWAAARNDWRQQATDALNGLHIAVNGSEAPSRETVYAPVHDIAGLAPVFEYHLLGRMARQLMDGLRGVADPLDERTVGICRTYITTMTALHGKDVRGEPDPSGEAMLTHLASLFRV